MGIWLTTAVAKMTSTIHHIVPRYISASVSTSQTNLLESLDQGSRCMSREEGEDFDLGVSCSRATTLNTAAIKQEKRKGVPSGS